MRAVRLPRGSSPTARTRGAAGSVPPDLVREADAEDGVGEVIPIRCPTSSVRPTRTSAPTPGRGPARVRRRGPALTARPTRVIMAAPGSRPPPTPGLPGPGWRDPKPGWAGVGLRNSVVSSTRSRARGRFGPVPACVMRAQRDAVHPASRRASPARRNPPALDSCEPTWRNASPGDITKTTPPGVGTGERRARLRAAPRLPGERNSGGRRADGQRDRIRPRTAVSGEKGSPNQWEEAE